MRKLIVSEFLTLDGVMENPDWTWPSNIKAQQRFKLDELRAAGALLLGRKTYQAFAASWPLMGEQAGEYGAMMNGYPKYVVTSTLVATEWNNSHLLRGDLVEEVPRLKQRPGKDILVFGSGELVDGLCRFDLVDEFRLMVFPVVAGTGKRLFKDGTPLKTLKHVDTTTFEGGVVVITYRR